MCDVGVRAAPEGGVHMNKSNEVLKLIYSQLMTGGMHIIVIVH